MHCAIHQKGSDVIHRFVRDAVRVGNNIRGSKGVFLCERRRIEDHWAIRWTEDVAEPVFDESGQRTGWSKAVSDLRPVPEYEGKPMGTREDVDAITHMAIRTKYSAEHEVELLRRKCMNNQNHPFAAEWDEYVAHVEGAVAQGRKFKDKHFPKQKETAK